MKKIVGISGWIGSGKDTVADFLVQNHGFIRHSWASSLKDAVSSIFGWDREMLEGLTVESRIEREKIDQWWANRLGMPDLSPRKILQLWGTEVGRRSFHDDIWIASVENRIRNQSGRYVISDCRFPNELQSIKNSGGITIWVVRGDLPVWYDTALEENSTPWDQQWILYDNGKTMKTKYPEIHDSEWSWVGHPFDHIVKNDGTIEELYDKISGLIN